MYRKLISGYMIRHKVRPGITGLAQVNGLRGETETLDKMSERVRYDLEYLRYWSPWLDVEDSGQDPSGSRSVAARTSTKASGSR